MFFLFFNAVQPLTPFQFSMKKINDDKMAFMRDILGIQTEMGMEMLRAACECVQLFDTKQLDYGSSNITLNGELGVAVRLQDKVGRMRTSCSRS